MLEDVNEVLSVFPCKLQEFLAMYLGAPLSLTRPRRAQEQTIIDSVSARIPAWKAGLLTMAGRATLAQTTLSAISVHVAICCGLSAWAIEEIDKRRLAFLWAGTDSVASGKCKLSWPVVCSPKDLGGLGLPDLRVLSYTLRLRWEWLRRSHPDAVWALLPSRPERKVTCMFQSSVTVHVGDGASARFWTDSWLPDGPLCQSAPNLFKVMGRKRRALTVREALNGRQWARDITGAPTVVMLLEYFHVWDTLEMLQLDPLTPDRYIWRWTPCGTYTASSAYRAFFFGRTPLAGAKLVWRAAVPPKVKFFFWLALHGRLWTADRRKRHGLQPEAICALCDQANETTDHLLSSCPFTREVWARLLARVGLQHLAPESTATLAD
jgi:hypothetical protein